MSLSSKKTKIITEQIIIESVSDYCNKKRVYNFKLLDLIVPKEAKIRSVIGGLETSFGVKLWEKLCKALAKENGFQIIDKNLLEPIVEDNLKSSLLSVMHRRHHVDSSFNAHNSKEAIRSLVLNYLNNQKIIEYKKPPPGHGVDVWLFKNNCNYIFDLKTVQPNVGSWIRFLDQIHNWYWYFYSKHPTEKVIAKVIFPYNPYKGSFLDNTIGHGAPMEHGAEFLSDNGFWHFITDNSNAYSDIMNSFKQVRPICSQIICDFVDKQLSNKV